MAKVINFGSINVDHVYFVDHFVRPGETLSCAQYQRFAGGKGLNQSIALAHAGVAVYHAGKIGKADRWLSTLLQEHGVNTWYVKEVDGPSGHAVIQVNSEGENSIVIFGGANEDISATDVKHVTNELCPDDYVLVQNEVSAVPEILRASKERASKVVFNPAPMTKQVSSYPLDMVDIFVMNEIEAQELTDETEPEQVRTVMQQRYPHAAVVLTLGAEGAIYFDEHSFIGQAAEKVEPVDTTAAGDTFAGFFLAELIRTNDPKQALSLACRAAAVCVTRKGASDSIPRRQELE